MTAPSPLAPALAALRQRYQADKAQLLAPLQAPGGPAVRLLLQRLTQLVDQQLLALADTQDDSHHVLAGRVLSPRDTPRVEEAILQFLKPLLGAQP